MLEVLCFNYQEYCSSYALVSLNGDMSTGFRLDTTLLPLLVGAVLGILFSLIFVGQEALTTKFLFVSAVYMGLVGAGHFSHGMAEFQTAADFTDLWEYVVYNISKCCSLRFELPRILRAFFGFTPYPSVSSLK